MQTARIAKHVAGHSLKYALLSLVLLAYAMHVFALPKLTSPTVQRYPVERPHSINLPHIAPDFWNPWNVSDNRPGNYVYTVTINWQPHEQTRFAVFPSGCIDRMRLNDREVPFDVARRCNRDMGFAMDLDQVLRPGPNELQILVSNTQTFIGSRTFETATYGLHIAPVFFGSPESPLSIWLSLLLATNACILLALIVRKVTGDYFAAPFVCGGFVMFLRQVKDTSYMQYVIDMPSHFQYICYIANHGFAPKPMEGWEYYHPPLYYEIEAKIMLLSNWLGSVDAITAMRLFSVACMTVSLVFCVMILNRLIANRFAYAAAVMLMAFYPGGIFYAPRLDSHLLLYSFYAGCFYFLMRWLVDNRIGHLWMTIVMFGLAIATRSNALALVPVIAAACLYQYRAKRLTLDHFFTLGMAASIIVVFAGLSMNFGRTIHFRSLDRTNVPLVISNISGIQRGQDVQNSIRNFVFLDTQKLYNPPFLDWLQDHTGRQYFWNSVIKTSLFEHLRWHATGYARYLISLLLAMVVYMGISLCLMRLEQRKAWYIFSVSFSLSLLMLMLNRVFHPFAPSQDFRYIYPALVSFCGILGLIIEQYFILKHHKRAVLGMTLVVLFSYASVVLLRAG